VSFFAYPTTQFGCNVTGGDDDDDAYDEIVTGDAGGDLTAGSGPDPAATSELEAFAYDGALTALTPTFVPFPGAYGVVATAGALGF